jgi:hypothetical protein
LLKKKHFTVSQLVSVLKVLQQLPEGLAIKVLAASPARLQHHLSILHPSLHCLSVEAAFPSIRRHYSLTLDLSKEDLTTAFAVLHAATAGTIGFCALRKLKLFGIPEDCNACLQQVISAACKSASDVRLHFSRTEPQLLPPCPRFPKLEDSLAQNSGLTSLQLFFL